MDESVVTASSGLGPQEALLGEEFGAVGTKERHPPGQGFDTSSWPIAACDAKIQDRFTLGDGDGKFIGFREGAARKNELDARGCAGNGICLLDAGEEIVPVAILGLSAENESPAGVFLLSKKFADCLERLGRPVARPDAHDFGGMSDCGQSEKAQEEPWREGLTNHRNRLAGGGMPRQDSCCRSHARYVE